MALDDAAFPNHKNLLGIDNTLSQLIKAATPIRTLGISESVTKMLNSNQLSGFATPKWANVLGTSHWQDGLKNAHFLENTFSNELRSLAALAQPLAGLGAEFSSQHAADLAGFTGISKALAEAARAPDIWQHAAFARNWQKDLITDWAALARQPFIPTWTTQLQSIGKLMGEAQEYLNTAGAASEEVVTGDRPELHVADAINALSIRLDGFVVTSAADVAVLRQEMNAHFATTVADIQTSIVELAKAGKSPLAKFALIFGIVSSFLTLISFPAYIDWCIIKMQSHVPVTEQAVTKQELKEFKAELIDSVKRISAQQGKLWVVERAVRVRSKPSPKSASLGVLSAGLQITQLDSVGKYIYISLQDVDALPVHGWVLKKYLKRSGF